MTLARQSQLVVVGLSLKSPSDVQAPFTKLLHRQVRSGQNYNKDRILLPWFRPSPKPDRSVDLAKRRLKHQIVGLTCTGKTDGGGAQVQAVMSAILLSKKLGIPYFHTAFASVEHGENPSEFALRWEQAFNLGKAFAPPPATIPQVKALDLQPRDRRRPIILSQEHYHGYADKEPDQYADIIKQLRPNLALPTPVKTAERQIAVHIRRGDVESNSQRFTPNEAILTTLQQLKSKYQDANIHIYSEGDSQDFGDFAGCALHLNQDIFETIAALISADILLMAKSSLSYVAAVFSTGKIYYTPFWHSPMSRWAIVAPGGEIPAEVAPPHLLTPPAWAAQ